MTSRRTTAAVLATVTAAGLLPLTLMSTSAGASPAVAATRAHPGTISRSTAGVNIGTRYINDRRVSVLSLNQVNLRFRFIPGTQSPGGYNGTLDRPSSYAGVMVAAFNGGFLLNSGAGGYYFRGATYKHLSAGLGSLVIRKTDGRLDVVKWRSGASPAGYSVVRQNLPLLIDNGANKTVGRNGCNDWGAYGSGSAAHCPGERSAVGVTANGLVYYVYGYRVKAGDLAAALKSYGVVRAMVLEMNQTWPRAYYKSGGVCHILDGNMDPAPNCYRNGYKRDFVIAWPK